MTRRILDRERLKQKIEASKRDLERAHKVRVPSHGKPGQSQKRPKEPPPAGRI